MEIPDSHVGPQISQDSGNQHHLIVVNPHDSALIHDVRCLLRIERIDFLVGLPPRIMEFGINSDIVKERPQGSVTEPLVVALHEFFLHRHRKERNIVDGE